MIRFSREKVLLLHQLLTEETGGSVGRARNNPVNLVNLVQNSSRRSNDRQMSLLPKQIAWTEPWSVEYVKERLRQCRKELPSPWRMAAYCVVLPTVVMSVAKAFLPTLEWSRVLRVILGLPVAFITLPFLISVFPTCIHIFASGVTFQVGNTCSHIDIKNIAALSSRRMMAEGTLLFMRQIPREFPMNDALAPAEKRDETGNRDGTGHYRIPL